MNLFKRKSDISIGFSIRPLYLDIFCLFLLIGLNPITYFFPLSPWIFSPDVLSYATMATDFFSKGLLYVPSWGHVDYGLVLPPLFPLLIACGKIFSQETLAIAEFVSSICMLMFMILIFFYVRKISTRLIAVIAVIIIQINYYFFLIGMTPLSESVFLLTIGLTLWLALLFFKNPSKEQKMLSFFLGISCSLVFLSRQIGIIIYVFVGILFIIQYFIIYRNERGIILKNSVFAVFGVIVLFIPYTTALYLQTGQHPLTQGFRKNDYLITVSDPEILQEIEKENVLPPELKKTIEAQPNKDYGILYAERRRMRKLLPDATEMYAYVAVVDKVKTDDKTEIVLSNFKDPGAYFVRLYNNIIHLKSALGSFNTFMFFILCFLSIAVKTDKNRDLSRFLLLSFIFFYLLVISLLTDRISRYIYILFPFCIMHVSIESYRFIKKLKNFYKTKFPNSIIFIFLFTLILLTTPKFFTELKLNAKFMNSKNKESNAFKEIINGEPVFSLFPFEAFNIGSTYRILPNDSLEKVVRYGKKTNVGWILISRTQGSIRELQLYTNVNWYLIGSLEKAYPDLVKFRLGTRDGSLALYEIL